MYVRLNEICAGSFLVRTKLKTSLKFMVQMPIAERVLSFTKCYRRPYLPYLLRSLNISLYACVCVFEESGVRCVSVHIPGFKLLECNASSGAICIIKCSFFSMPSILFLHAFPDFWNRHSQFDRIKIAQVNCCIEFCIPVIYSMVGENMLKYFFHTFVIVLLLSSPAFEWRGIACTSETGKQCNIIRIF